MMNLISFVLSFTFVIYALFLLFVLLLWASEIISRDKVGQLLCNKYHGVYAIGWLITFAMYALIR